MSNEIIFFGCWNNGGCDLDSTNPNSLTTTIKGLNDYLSNIEKKPKTLIVAGDNYYPKKNKKTKDDKTKNDKPSKIFKQEEISSGFDCLQELDIEKKFILLGNHDLEKTIEGDNEEECNATIYQKYLSDNNRNFNFFNFNSGTATEPRTLEIIRISNHTIIIMFDSSIYEKKPEIYLECYNKLRSEETKFESIDAIKQLQIIQRGNTIKELNKIEYSKIKNIVFACHHPLFYFTPFLI